MNSERSISSDFIRELPKTETHLHLEGALPWYLLMEAKPDCFDSHPFFREVDFRYNSFEEFESILIDHALAFFDSAESYYEASRAIFKKQLQQNIKYVEISFHAGMLEFLKIPGPEIIAAIKDAIPADLEVRIFLGMSRNSYTPYLGPLLEDAAENWDFLAGIDLHGLESIPMEGWTKPLWKKAGQNGKILKAHAGEFGPAENVRYAIQELGVRRIQHGTLAVEDQDVINLAKDNNVTFDQCPISNYKLRVIETWEDHPLPRLISEGLLCTVSTDDPLSFNNSLLDEYQVCHEKLGLCLSDLKGLAVNGFAVADVSSEIRDHWINEIESLSKKHGIS